MNDNIMNKCNHSNKDGKGLFYYLFFILSYPFFIKYVFCFVVSL